MQGLWMKSEIYDYGNEYNAYYIFKNEFQFSKSAKKKQKNINKQCLRLLVGVEYHSKWLK